jgi:hypothetical protein
MQKPGVPRERDNNRAPIQEINPEGVFGAADILDALTGMYVHILEDERMNEGGVDEKERSGRGVTKRPRLPRDAILVRQYNWQENIGKYFFSAKPLEKTHAFKYL